MCLYVLLALPSDQILVKPCCYHLSFNVSTSLPNSSLMLSKLLLSLILPTEPIADSKPFLMRLWNWLNLIVTSPIRLLKQSQILAIRFSIVLVLALIPGLTVLEIVSVYLFQLLCSLELVLWQVDQ